jgi:hypothetical protein
MTAPAIEPITVISDYDGLFGPQSITGKSISYWRVSRDDSDRYHDGDEAIKNYHAPTPCGVSRAVFG